MLAARGKGGENYSARTRGERRGCERCRPPRVQRRRSGRPSELGLRQECLSAGLLCLAFDHRLLAFRLASPPHRCQRRPLFSRPVLLSCSWRPAVASPVHPSVQRTNPRARNEPLSRNFQAVAAALHAAPHPHEPPGGLPAAGGRAPGAAAAWARSNGRAGGRRRRRWPFPALQLWREGVGRGPHAQRAERAGG